MTDTIDRSALFGALAKAQGEITGALKDSSNPFFKSKYADLASCWDACRQQLSSNGLAVIQTTDFFDGYVVLSTKLVHSSGQWVEGILPIKTKDDGPQAQGSGITYARRYALAAIVGLAQIDDDAEAAQGRDKKVTPMSEATLTPTQEKHVSSFVDAINGILQGDYTESEMGARLLDLRQQMSEDNMVFEAVWKCFDSKTRAAIKKLIEIGKKEAA